MPLILLAGYGTATAAVPTISISQLQGRSHVSPFLEQTVNVTGVVTAVSRRGFYVQDQKGDGDPSTSDGVFVYCAGRPTVAVGDAVELRGHVDEYIPGGRETGNLSITQLTRPSVTVLSSDNELPAPTRLGRGGRIPPRQWIISPGEIEPPINLQNPADARSTPYNPDVDGIDFYESLEGMRVTVEAPVTISATRAYSSGGSELYVLANRGLDAAPASARTGNGGLLLQPGPDRRGAPSPARLQIQFDKTLYPGKFPAIPTGTPLGDVSGVVGYSYGSFEIYATEVLDVGLATLAAETTALTSGPDHVTVASYNVLNLSPLPEDDRQRTTLAAQIVHNLRAPDVIALQEIQDNSGAKNDGIVAADRTLAALVAAIEAAGGPRYQAIDVPPVDGTAGGIPGGNIRNACLYNPARVQRVDHYALSPSVLKRHGVRDKRPFDDTRTPLLAVFAFRDQAFTVINNHLTSRYGSTPVYGGPQPYVQARQEVRATQCGALHQVIKSLLKQDRGAHILVVGDFNTFPWTSALSETLPGTGSDRVLRNLIPAIANTDAYSFIFSGHSKVLDNAFVSDSLVPHATADIVHVNVDFPRVDDTTASDHEPVVVRFSCPRTSNHP